MFTITIKNPIHRFFFLFGVLAVLLSLARVILFETPSYVWMNWNLFLALLPLVFAYLFVKNRNKKWLGALLFVAWLFFLPNAPYMITDFIHIANVGPSSLHWFDGLMLFSFAVVGIGSFVYSTFLVHRSLGKKPWFVPVVSLLSGFGIYLGRYLRWNTWDLIHRPGSLFAEVATVVSDPLQNEPMLMMTIVFGLTLFIMYVACEPVLSYEKTNH